MKGFHLRKRASGMALAIALATGAVVATGAIYAEPAHAQKKKKKDKEQASAYSKEFVDAYQPLNEAANAEGADVNALKPQLLALVPLAQSDDEKIAAGGMIYNAAIKVNDPALQLAGMELMLASNKVPLEQVGRYNFIAYQLADGQKQYAKSRQFLQQAITTNFSAQGVTVADLRIAMAESFFQEKLFKEGLAYLDGAIKDRQRMNQPVEERWYRRGLTVAYNNRIVPEVYDFTLGWLTSFPSNENWRDAINLTRNLNEFGDQEILDLLRLSAKVDALQNKQDYIIYVEAADARRLPFEVKNLIEQGYASGSLSRDDIFLADSLSTATGRIAVDRRELPSLERDAGAAGASLRTVVAAGDAFLSYGEYAKAARFYEKSLGMPGVETPRVLTRLGIAQVAMGQHDAAQATFAKVQGQRAPIAQLWSAYADMQQGGSATATTAADTTIGG
ncbi:hypothetical protein [Erythrobacter sp. JK5]|uniref:hypothetical protein n=1 Tax=Erythrobacter sp. JK5 TaxID=2829500 RepID=UPI001BA69303|nr:hypothetical protein [Erythrobacter sp. JK5]QUL38679.1 hypothetical protein KDC96_04645 [Erythrobacter sp. JK5]